MFIVWFYVMWCSENVRMMTILIFLFQLFHEATLIGLLETIMYHRVSMLLTLLSGVDRSATHPSSCWGETNIYYQYIIFPTGEGGDISLSVHLFIMLLFNTNVNSLFDISFGKQESCEAAEESILDLLDFCHRKCSYLISRYNSYNTVDIHRQPNYYFRDYCQKSYDIMCLYGRGRYLISLYNSYNTFIHRQPNYYF